MTRFLRAAALVLVASIVAPATADARDLLGTKTVKLRAETDVVRTPGTQRYRSVQICVAQRAVRFGDLDIVFANGDKVDARVRNVIRAGDCTRWIDLPGARRDIRRIVLRYDTLGGGKRAKVTAWGR
ncbi:MAG: hypothetical protein AAF439_10035 [Pseudomonadota bacterium]